MSEGVSDPGREKPEAVRVLQDASRVGLGIAIDEARGHQVWFELDTAEALITLLRQAVDEVRQRQQEHGVPPLRVPALRGDAASVEGWDVIFQDDGQYSVRFRLEAGRNVRIVLQSQALARLSRDLQRVIGASSPAPKSSLN